MKRTVLLAACRPEVLQTVPATLKLAGFKVAVVESGLKALSYARSGKASLILLDAALPDMDGATVADILKTLPSTAGIMTFLFRPARTTSSEAGGSEALESCNQTDLLLQVGQILALCGEMATQDRVYEGVEPLLSAV